MRPRKYNTFHKAMMKHLATKPLADPWPASMEAAVNYSILSMRPEPAYIISDDIAVIITWEEGNITEVATFRPAAQKLERFVDNVKVWETTI